MRRSYHEKISATPGACGGQDDSVDDADPLEVLRRWEDAGGTWRIALRRPDRLVLDLLSCDAGEVMGRVDASPPDEALTAHVTERPDDPTSR
jgi:hypothetical protein